nr:MAG TPA: hypothetical protein [Caudoviricetes sp.]DAO15804.1 MAG TPA: hypothetical protein [Caudoviricetes sp.]
MLLKYIRAKNLSNKRSVCIMQVTRNLRLNSIVSSFSVLSTRIL